MQQLKTNSDEDSRSSCIKHLMNHVRMVRSLMKGQGGIGNDHPIGPAYGADHCEELEQRPFDPDTAAFPFHSARGETDRSKRKEMLCEIRPLIHDEAGTPLPFHSNYVDGKRDVVKSSPRVPVESFGGSEWPEAGDST